VIVFQFPQDPSKDFIKRIVGIAGDEHFEVLEGLKAGDTVVAGPYQSVRDLKDSTKVRQARETGAAGAPKKAP